MIKQVIVMRTDLGMRKGKMIAQGAHASMIFLLRHLQDDNSTLTKEQTDWAFGSFTKICVGVESEEKLLEIMQQAKDAGLTVYDVIDNGATEFKGIKTRTCCAIGPNDADEIDKITGSLKLL